MIIIFIDDLIQFRLTIDRGDALDSHKIAIRVARRMLLTSLLLIPLNC